MPRTLGLHSAWIGEHHFNSLGVLVLPRSGAGPYRRARPRASAWRRRSRCCRCTTPSASPSNGPRSISSATAGSISPPGRGYDRREYLPFKSISTTTRRFSRRAWRWCAACGTRAASASRIRGNITSSRMCASRRKPVQRPIPAYVGFVLQALDRAGRAAELRPHRRALCGRHEFRRAAGRLPTFITRPAPSTAREPGRLMCSYFTHFSRHQAEEAAARARQIRYYKECVITGLARRSRRPRRRATAISSTWWKGCTR